MNWKLTLHGATEPREATRAAYSIADSSGWLAASGRFVVMSFTYSDTAVILTSNNRATLGVLAQVFSSDLYSYERLTIEQATKDDTKAAHQILVHVEVDEKGKPVQPYQEPTLLDNLRESLGHTPVGQER